MANKKSLRYKIGIRLRWFVRFTTAIFLLYIGSQYIQPHIAKYRTNKIAEELNAQYGLVVRYGDPSEFRILPEPAVHTIYDLEIEPTNIQGAYNAIVGIKDGLSKYSAELIKDNLAAVFISGTIKSNGIKAGGTVLGKWIYVSADQADVSRNPETYAETFHHEFSSILKREHNFPTIRWALANKPGFKYPENKMDIIKAAASENRGNPKEAHQWHDSGFVHDYGMSSMVNDFNTYAELAMAHPEKLIQLSEQYPRIRLKTSIFVEFYTKLSPELKEYFISVGLDDIFSLVSSKGSNNIEP